MKTQVLKKAKRRRNTVIGILATVLLVIAGLIYFVFVPGIPGAYKLYTLHQEVNAIGTTNYGSSYGSDSYVAIYEIRNLGPYTMQIDEISSDFICSDPEGFHYSSRFGNNTVSLHAYPNVLKPWQKGYLLLHLPDSISGVELNTIQGLSNVAVKATRQPLHFQTPIRIEHYDLVPGRIAVSAARTTDREDIYHHLVALSRDRNENINGFMTGFLEELPPVNTSSAQNAYISSTTFLYGSEHYTELYMSCGFYED